MSDLAEKKRLEACGPGSAAAGMAGAGWRKWGPYLSERQWGTVREDYSRDGNAWDYFSHDQARSRAYRWGEDGLGGICDDHQVLCFALALWNGKDPILKERLFGLTNSEGNHGEDVKEYYYYLDSTPTHSYMKFLYKYPQRAYPYGDLVRTNRARGRRDQEYELIDTGVFDDDRYFDVYVEYAKAVPEDVLIRITVENRGPEEAVLHLLPTIWFRNTWSWRMGGSKPVLRALDGKRIEAVHTDPFFKGSLPDYLLSCEGTPEFLFTENETNEERVFGQRNATPFVKDGIHNYVVGARRNAVNPALTGTKASARHLLQVAAREAAVVRLRLSAKSAAPEQEPFGDRFEQVISDRLREADEYYASITPPSVGKDEALVMRQALAGMLWTKQYYYFDAGQWLEEHDAHPLRGPSRRRIRNREWFHMVNDHIISMPDKWEYPWFAAWDLAFQAIALSVVDPDFAKQQLDLMLQQTYLHPSGQIPAYEWNFSDVNPPVHAWATQFLYNSEQVTKGEGDLDFLKRSFAKLMLNFTWWVNRKDRLGSNVFEGGFLGLDNIGVFDRSAALPTGGYLEQADGTAWMALFCQNMVGLSVELAAHDPIYEELCIKFLEHFLWIALAMNRPGADGMWDEEDGFYYDMLRLPNGSARRLKVRSMVGLLPLCSATVVEEWQRQRVPRVVQAWSAHLERIPELKKRLHSGATGRRGVANRGLFSLLTEERLRRVLGRMLDENEFLGPYGIRALSRYHRDHPYVFRAGGQEFRVEYLPAESDSAMFGGNSNWRGPVWMPVNVLLIRALLNYYLYYGDDFKIEYPTGSGNQVNLFEVARGLARRLTSIFLRDENGRRPVFGGAAKFQTDPHWRDHILFYEYFHGDNGAGLGASHQTGWTGLVAKLIELFGHLDAETALRAGARAAHRPDETTS